MSELDRAVADLAARKDAWVALPVADKISLLGALRRSFAAVGPEWVANNLELQGVDPDSPAAGWEWLGGPYFVLRNLRLLERSLIEIQRTGRPRLPGPALRRADGRWVASVFPATLADRLLFPLGMTAEVRILPGQEPTQAALFREPPKVGRVCLLLSAVNVSSLGPTDALSKLFCDGSVVLYKSHPANPKLADLVERGFAPLVEAGFLRIARGDVDAGGYLAHHPQVDEIHVTGSDRTYEALVFGTGDEGLSRKTRDERRLHKPVGAELGNVTPWIVVPGPWSPSDIAEQAERLAASVTANAAFNCLATRLVITAQRWDRRPAFLDALRRALARTPTHKAWYPGAHERFARFSAAHPEAEHFGKPSDGHLPWGLASDLDPEAANELCFRAEPFCGFLGEVALDAGAPHAFLAAAVAFANRRLWGSLNATIVVHPDSLAAPEMHGALEQALDRLHYGTITLNESAIWGFSLLTTPWGAFPGHEPKDIQSGVGHVHNTLMFDHPEKAVVRAPFHSWPPAPWSPRHRTAHQLGRALCRYAESGTVADLAAVVWQGLRA